MKVFVYSQFNGSPDWLESIEEFAELPRLGTDLRLYKNEPHLRIVSLKRKATGPVRAVIREVEPPART
jgi:hypothetical protein